MQTRHTHMYTLQARHAPCQAGTHRSGKHRAQQALDVQLRHVNADMTQSAYTMQCKLRQRACTAGKHHATDMRTPFTDEASIMQSCKQGLCNRCKPAKSASNLILLYRCCIALATGNEASTFAGCAEEGCPA